MKVRRLKKKTALDMIKLAKMQYFVPFKRWASAQMAQGASGASA